VAAGRHNCSIEPRQRPSIVFLAIMKIHLCAIGLSFVAQAEIGETRAEVLPPPQAVAAGFTNLIFDQEPGPWDIGFGVGGHKWNAGMWFQTVPSPSSFTLDANGIMTITNSTGMDGGVGTSLCTQFYQWPDPTWSGTSFTGGYFEAYMFCTDWSAFWLYDAAGPLGIPVNAADPQTWIISPARGC
jgi:hypothetical protein